MSDPAAAPTLSPAQKKYLRGLAQRMKPAVLLGKAGLTETAVQEIDTALARDELVKVRLPKTGEKDALCAKIAEETSSACAGGVGGTASFYRPAKDPAARAIRLP